MEPPLLPSWHNVSFHEGLRGEGRGPGLALLFPQPCLCSEVPSIYFPSPAGLSPD